MMKIVNLKRSNLKKAFLYAAIPFVAATGLSVFSFVSGKQTDDERKTPETEVLHFLVDTLFINRENYDKCLTMAFYMKKTKTITSYWAEVDSTGMTKNQAKVAKERAMSFNFGLEKISNLLHENRHKHNHEIYNKIKMKFAQRNTVLLKPEHTAELYMHDEVTANIEQLLYARDLYLEGMPLDSIPIPSAAYRKFLRSSPKLTNKISPDEMAILAQKGKEWVQSSKFKERYSRPYRLNISCLMKANANKKQPSDESSNKIFHEILSHYYTFYYHGKSYSIRFESLPLWNNVQQAILETGKNSSETTVSGSSHEVYAKKRSSRKKGSGKIYSSQMLPNYNPNINSL